MSPQVMYGTECQNAGYLKFQRMHPQFRLKCHTRIWCNERGEITSWFQLALSCKCSPSYRHIFVWLWCMFQQHYTKDLVMQDLQLYQHLHDGHATGWCRGPFHPENLLISTINGSQCQNRVELVKNMTADRRHCLFNFVPTHWAIETECITRD